MGKPSRDKGARYERETVRDIQSWGLVAHRVPLSGAVDGYADDVVIEHPTLGDLRIECKRRAKIASYLVDAAHQSESGIARARGDRAPSVWILTDDALRRLLREAQ